MERFKLRAWARSGILSLAKYLNNKKIWDNCRDVLPYPYTKRDAEQFIVSLKDKAKRTITALRTIPNHQEISVLHCYELLRSNNI